MTKEKEHLIINVETYFNSNNVHPKNVGYDRYVACMAEMIGLINAMWLTMTYIAGYEINYHNGGMKHGSTNKSDRPHISLCHCRSGRVYGDQGTVGAGDCQCLEQRADRRRGGRNGADFGEWFA